MYIMGNITVYWMLLGNQNLKDPYLEAEVVVVIMGWLGWEYRRHVKELV